MGGQALLERPVLCCPLEGQGSCDRLADALLVQVRPDARMQPQLVIVGVCRWHVRAVAAHMAATWPDDAVDRFGVDEGERYLRVLLDGFRADGLTPLSAVGAG